MAKRLTYTEEQDCVILVLFRRKKLEKLTNLFIENEFARIFDIPKVAFITLSRRFSGMLLIIVYYLLILNLK